MVLPAVDSCGDPDRAARAEQLLWSGQYLGDVDQLRADLVEPAAQVGAARSAPVVAALSRRRCTLFVAHPIRGN